MENRHQSSSTHVLRQDTFHRLDLSLLEGLKNSHWSFKEQQQTYIRKVIQASYKYMHSQALEQLENMALKKIVIPGKDNEDNVVQEDDIAMTYQNDQIT